MSITRWIVCFVLTLSIFFGAYMTLNSTNRNNLEHKLLDESSLKIESIVQSTFGEGGLVLVGLDRQDAGIMEAYTKIPFVNRYVATKKFDFEKTDMPLHFAGESWKGFQALTFDGTKLKEEDASTGLGFTGRMIFWAAVAAILSLGATVGFIIMSRLRRQ